MLKRTISLMLALLLLFSLQAGALPAFAEERDLADAAAAILPTPAADGSHIDWSLVEKRIVDFLTENYWVGPDRIMSIAVWFPETEDSWYYHADEWLYGVNWYKLPVSMYFAEQVSQGSMTMDSPVYGLQLEYAISTALEVSSNPSASSMLGHLTESTDMSYTDVVKFYANLPDSYYPAEFYQSNSEYTARLMMEITKTLYLGGNERFPLVEESMKKSQPEDFFHRDWILRNKWEIAQTHAAYWGDGAGDYLHCTGILFTPTPVVLTVMTKNISDLDMLGGVAAYFMNLATALDQQLHPAAAVSAQLPGAVEAVPAVAEAVSEPQPALQNDGALPSGAAPAVPQENAADVLSVETASDGQEAPSISDPTQSDADTPPSGEMSEPRESDAASPSKPFRLFLVVFAVLFLVVIAVSAGMMIHERKERERRRRAKRRREKARRTPK